MNTPTVRPPFKIIQLFTTEASMKHRGDYLSRPSNTPHHPQQISVTMKMREANDGAARLVYVVVETNPNDGDEKALYDFSVEMIGIVDEVDSTAFNDRQLVEVVATILFPFVRETVANLTGRGRFGPALLNPFNVHGAVQVASEATEEQREVGA